MSKKIIIAGGGTGGHIFPAVAIADAIRREAPDTQILFVGAKGRMEMEKVPQAGYEIVGLEVVGFQRQQIWKNIGFPFKLLKSLFQALRVVLRFRPDACIGVGGYASGPVLFMAALLGKKIYIQEQNSYPGVTNKILSRFASRIFVAYDNLQAYFAPQKLQLTGNPVRQDIVQALPPKAEALQFFGLAPDKRTILVIGGSLGARTINEAIESNLALLLEHDCQVIWQTGKIYYEGIIQRNPEQQYPQVRIQQFIREMNYAYSAADIVISRAGALSISELCIIGKPAIFVPSPNVSEDHQTKNAMALVNKQAALLVRDHEAKETLGKVVVQLLQDEQQQQKLSAHIRQLAKTDAAGEVARYVLQQTISK